MSDNSPVSDISATPAATIDYADFQSISDIKFRVVTIIANLYEDHLYGKEAAIKDLKALLVRIIDHEDIYTGAILNEYEESLKEVKNGERG